MSPPSRGSKLKPSRYQAGGVSLSTDNVINQDIGLFITATTSILSVGKYYLGSLVCDY
jgi:hypothetical protein